ncbi:MAG: tetrahydrofolate dehydrogenase/cyclohydrolase catalytic domain-containing protein, partial [Deltaproteobacteria bacterium]|nr:tetrahydrofolate dehydrogenase/cyclohydrolase catalytic domain-containing protein [Deltaproteobacteria bacterium]
MENLKTASIINGKEVSASLRAELKAEIDILKKKHGLTPGLAVVLVGENPASKVYVRNKTKACEETGIRSFQHSLPESTKEGE